jgi:hypothetical protein
MDVGLKIFGNAPFVDRTFFQLDFYFISVYIKECEDDAGLHEKYLRKKIKMSTDNWLKYIEFLAYSILFVLVIVGYIY